MSDGEDTRSADEADAEAVARGQRSEQRSEKSEKAEESRPARSKSKSNKPEIWMEWTGPEGAHTPPLPSHDLTKEYVLVYLTSVEEAEGYEATGLWKLHIPDGGLRKTRPDVDQG